MSDPTGIMHDEALRLARDYAAGTDPHRHRWATMREHVDAYRADAEILARALLEEETRRVAEGPLLDEVERLRGEVASWRGRAAGLSESIDTHVAGKEPK